MLMQLLGDVEGLRAVQHGQPIARDTRPASLNSVENTRAPTDAGYEPEGQAGTSSTGDRSGFFSNNSSRQADHWAPGSGRRDSANRVSTVLEGDEDPEPLESHEQNVSNQRAIIGSDNLTPRQESRNSQEISRGMSVPLATPPRMHQAPNAALSNDNTPHVSSDGKANRRHKSTSSSFFPKISRWSKTTASSIGDNFRSNVLNTNKARPYSQASQSGSNIGEYAYEPHDDDRLRSNNSLTNDQYRDQENRPPSPLIPSQVSENPKYQAHRNSQNLQHPQPRQGPTGRYQHHLETEAQNYGEFSPTSQTSSQWEHQQDVAPARTVDEGRYTHGGHLSPISDAGYSETSSAMREMGRAEREVRLRSSGSSNSMGKSGPPRPPKVQDDEPLVPQRPPKIAMSPATNRQATYVDHVSAARSGSPAYDKV